MDQKHIEEKIFLSFLRALRVLRGKTRIAVQGGKGKKVDKKRNLLHIINHEVYDMQTVTVEEIKVAIQSLPKDDYFKLRDWLSQIDWELWDKKIENDAKQGKLDFLIEEALQEKEQDELNLL